MSALLLLAWLSACVSRPVVSCPRPPAVLTAEAAPLPRVEVAVGKDARPALLDALARDTAAYDAERMRRAELVRWGETHCGWSEKS